MGISANYIVQIHISPVFASQGIHNPTFFCCTVDLINELTNNFYDDGTDLTSFEMVAIYRWLSHFGVNSKWLTLFSFIFILSENRWKMFDMPQIHINNNTHVFDPWFPTKNCYPRCILQTGFFVGDTFINPEKIL